MLNQVGEITNPRKGRATQKVVVVNGSQEMLDLLESVLDAGHYDMVFVSDTEHAYSQIRQNRPQLVVLCIAFDDPAGYQLLSMLKLDADTAHIPILTYADEFEREDTDDEPDDNSTDDGLPLVRHELTMN